MKLSLNTCAQYLNNAALNRRTAFQIELAVGLGLFLTQGREARRVLCEAYATAGYQCLTPQGIDYKTINRRINATAELFARVPAATWAGKLNEEVLLRALVIGLEPLQLQGVSDVHRYCAPPKPPRSVPVKPHTRVLDAGATTGQAKVVALFQKAAKQVEAGAMHIETKHLALAIPANTPRAELLELARKLIEMAEMKKELLTA